MNANRFACLLTLLSSFSISLQGEIESNHLSNSNKGTAVMKKQDSILPQAGRGSSEVSYLGHSIDEMIHAFMAKENIPGLALAIVQAPYIPRVISYGLADIDQKRLASNRTIWALGPISQGYAAIAIMQLYEKGKLKLDDKAAKYMKGLPEAWNEVTIMALLQHSSGIADYRFEKNYTPDKNTNSDGLIALVKDVPLAFKPGTDILQSATNYLLLANIVETVSQTSYRDFVTKNQIEFLGLKHTTFAEDFNKIKQEDLSAKDSKHHEFLKFKEYINPEEVAVGYDQALKPQPMPPSLKGFADIWASAEDVSFWDIALAGSVLIEKPENRALIYQPTTLANGKKAPAMAGWQFYHHKGLMDIKGTVRGFSSFLSRFTDPSELVCVTLLINKENIDLTNLARLIASVYGKELSSNTNDNELYTYESVFSAEDTIDRIEKELKALNIPIFGKFNHGKNAKDVNLSLPPTQVIVFGSPAVGTKLMQDNPSISIELPLKIAVWEDARGRVWVAFPQMDKLSERYQGIDNETINKMQILLEKIVKKSANIY